jgi:hypothetical protein
VISEVIGGMNVTIALFWGVTPCILIEIYLRVEGNKNMIGAAGTYEANIRL